MGSSPSRFSKSSISEDDLVDLHGKVTIVTGGNTGVGYGTVQFLVRKGAKVYIAGRSEERISAAIKQLELEDIRDGTLHMLKLDLADPRSAKKAAEEFFSKETRLDILVNNAAIGPTGPYRINQDGLLDIMTTNHISHFAFTEALLPVLKKSAQEKGSDIRIVNVSSNAHGRPKPESLVGKESLNRNYGDSVNGYLETYGHSKLANILHIKNLQKRLDAENIPITCIAVHPGSVATVGLDKFLNNLPVLGWGIKTFIGPIFFSSWRTGGMNPAFAAAGKHVKEYRKEFKGAYLTPVANITQSSKFAMDERLATELYETTKGVLEELGL